MFLIFFLVTSLCQHVGIGDHTFTEPMHAERIFEVHYPMLNNIDHILYQHKIPHVVIRLNVSYDKAVERISARDGDNKDAILVKFPNTYADYILFGQSYSGPLYELNNESDEVPSLEGALEFINKFSKI